MRLDPARFAGRVSGREVRLFELRSSALSVAVCNHGARVLQLIVPDRQGRERDVVLGHDSLAQLLEGMPSMGAFIGRYANRIAGARFLIRGQLHRLPHNDPLHCVHGGPGGSRHQVFDVLTSAADRLTLAWTFRSVDDGFPGDVDLQLGYQVHGSTLAIDYSAVVRGASTPLNFTSHPFFNLEGQESGCALDHGLQIAADHFVPVGADRIALGHFEPVAGTAFDFRTTRTLRAAIAQGHEQLTVGGVSAGFDHSFVNPQDLAAGQIAGALRFQAQLQAPGSGVVMQVWSDAPSLQLYSSAGMDGSLPKHAGKHGRVHLSGSAVCLEPQRLPDAPNQVGFGHCIFEPGQRVQGRIEYRFSVSP